MNNFLELEVGYLVIGVFIILVTLFVGTRPFVGNGQAWKKIVPISALVMFIFISAHYYVTTSRMSDVKYRFNHGGAIICESKALRKVAQSIIIDPKKPQGWILVGNKFKSPQFQREFYTARCLEYFYPNKNK